MSRTKDEQERLEKTVDHAVKKIAKARKGKSMEAKVQKYQARMSKRQAKMAQKAELKTHLLRMLETPPADPNKPKPGEDKPSGARMYLRAFRPILQPDGYTVAYVPELGVPGARQIPQANDKANGSSQIGGGSHGGADEAAIYEVHMPDHGGAKVYATSPGKAFKRAMKYMATYSKMLTEQMFPGGQGAQNRDQKKPKDAEGLQIVNMKKAIDEELVFRG